MPDNRPNILLIVLDTLRRDRLSVYGHDRETSPELDAFAQDATLFERAIAPAQWTIPSHASMFTGLYPGTHQLTQANEQLSGSYPTIAEILQVAGYRTVGFCNNPLVGVLDNGLQRGFDEFYNYAGVSPNRPVDMKRNRARRNLIRQVRKLARRISNQFAQDERLFRLSLNPTFFPLIERFINYKGHTERSINDLIERWDVHGQSDEPLFGFLNLMGTHLPYRPPEEALMRVAPELQRDKRTYQTISRLNADAARWASPPDPPISEDERIMIDAFYDAEIAHQDVHLGRLLSYLKSSGALENTLVIITADHGEGHGDHDFFGHGFVVYQELVHVPLLIHYPQRFPAGSRVQTNISTRRIFHTLLDITELKPPIDEADPNANVAGLSLIASLNGKPDTEKGIAFAEAVPPQTFLHVLEYRDPSAIERLHLTLIRRGVYDGDHKLTLIGDQVEGLFNVAQDPFETQDVATSQPSQVSALQDQVAQFVTSTEQQRADNGLHSEVSNEVAENLRALGYFE